MQLMAQGVITVPKAIYLLYASGKIIIEAGGCSENNLFTFWKHFNIFDSLTITES